MQVNTALRPTCTDGRTLSPDVLKLSGFVAGVVDADGEGKERHGEGGRAWNVSSTGAEVSVGRCGRW